MSPVQNIMNVPVHSTLRLLTLFCLVLRSLFAYPQRMSFHGAPTRLALLVACKGCGRSISAGFRSVLDNAVAIVCPLCQEHRQYRPSEVYEGRIPFELLQGGKLLLYCEPFCLQKERRELPHLAKL